jgi:hypothetical protein
LVTENLYRWVNRTISSTSHDYRKDDARTIVFPVSIPADAEAVVRSAVQLVGGLFFPLAVRSWRAPTSEALTAKSSSAPRVEQAIDFARLCESV